MLGALGQQVVALDFNYVCVRAILIAEKHLAVINFGYFVHLRAGLWQDVLDRVGPERLRPVLHIHPGNVLLQVGGDRLVFRADVCDDVELVLFEQVLGRIFEIRHGALSGQLVGRVRRHRVLDDLHEHVPKDH